MPKEKPRELKGQKMNRWIKEYQCAGCVKGDENDGCFKADNGVGCYAHLSGTTIMPHIGRIFLGMKKGFNRHGPVKDMTLQLFENYQQAKSVWGYNFFNICVWKHLNEHGHTVIRGLSPRINQPFLHVILEDCIEQIDCFEITQEHLDGMD